jgi:tetratricopeptide (TPR) repeat protein
MKTRLILGAACAAGLLAVPPAQAVPVVPQTKQAQPLSKFDTAMTEAFEALGKRNPDEARKLFREAAALDPKSMLPWLGLADVAKLSNDLPSIEAALRKAADLAPASAAPVTAQARLAYAQRKYPEAEALWRKAAQLDPSSPVPLVDLGDYYAGPGRDLAKAEALYRKAIKLDPKHGGAHYAIGMMLAARGDRAGSIASFERALELSGDNVLPLLALGKVYAQARKTVEAREAYSRALRIQPRLAAALVGRAEVFAETGNAKSALADLQAASDIEPKNVDILMRIGMLQQRERAHTEAYAAYEKALALEPKTVLAYNNLAWMAAERKERLADALAWITRARELEPKSSLLMDTHGWVLRARGDLDGAARVLSEGIALRPDADLHYHLGVVQMEQEKRGLARENFRKALQIRPDFDQALDAKRRLKDLESPAPKQN